MTETKSAPPRRVEPAAPLPPSIVGRDREFLPAALEILETPPPPLPVAMMLTICGFVAAALVWSFIGHLDILAVALGKIEPIGRAKIVQPIEPGKIAVIHVENGDPVKAGDLLLELDPVEAAADAHAARDARHASLAEIARRRFAIKTVQSLQHGTANDPAAGGPDAVSEGGPTAKLIAAMARADREVAWDEATSEELRMREQAVLEADLGHLIDTLGNIDLQIAQKQATRERLKMSMTFQDQLIETLNARVDVRQESMARELGTKINLYDAKEDLQKSQSTLASDQGQLIETAAALRELESQQTKALSQFIADNANKFADAARKADEAREQLAKAEARLSHTKLYAPIDGSVQQLSVTTVGQVVTTGQQLMMVTPRGGGLQVEALVSNLDIGFVKLGQEAMIKIDAFPFTRFGTVSGKVTRIASEAVDEAEAKRALANAAASGNVSTVPSTPPGQPDSFVFPVTIAVDRGAIAVGSADIPLAPGMTAVVEIRTGSRRVLDYLLSPLTKAVSESFKER